MSDELLPCPFCGEEPTYSEQDGYHLVKCTGDCILYEQTFIYDTCEQLQVEWNTRTNIDARQREDTSRATDRDRSEA